MKEKIKEVLENQKVQTYAVAIAVFTLLITVFAVSPWATDGYEDVTTKEQLSQRLATAVTNHEEQVLIDYSGEDFENLKSWLKEEFYYPELINHTDEFTIYNYDGAKFTYWSYGHKKRVKITILYKLTNEQIASVNAYADDFINANGLRGMSQYEQVKFVHDFLINNFAYNVNEYNIYNMIQNKQANCYGYAMMNYVILNKLGVNVRTTTGKMNNSHIWNAINLDGQWYYEDITWDTVSKGTDYFLISSAKLQQSHQILGNFIPDCPSDYVVSENNGSDAIIIETPIEEEENKDTGTVTVVEDETEKDVPEENDEADAFQATEQPGGESFRNDEDSTTNSSTTDATVPKTEKIQKLSKLLKALKTLKNK